MMMNTSCIAGCLDDVLIGRQESRRYGNRSKWAKESDKEFLMRMLGIEKGEDVSSSSPSSTPDTTRREPPTGLPESYASIRQRYLRSYTFSSKKQSAAQRTKNWIKEKRTTFMAGNLKGRSCSFMDACLKFLLLCVAKVDVREF